jgi:CO/xanthine dehydrogenase Mo-binding subunit
MNLQNPSPWALEMKRPPRPKLPTDKVLFVSDPVASVVAEALWQAKDAAEAVKVAIGPLGQPRE